MLKRNLIVCCGIAFLATSLDSVTQAQGRGGRGGMPLTRLLGMAEVQNELKLEGHMLEKVTAFAEEAQQKFRDEMQMIRDQGLNEDEQREEMAAALEQFTTKSKEEVAKLLTPEQMKRLNQLLIQQQGPTAVLRPEVGDAIGFTAEERADLQAKVDELNAANREKMQSLSQDDREQFQRIMEEGRKAVSDLVTSTLSDEEKQKFEELKGAPFTFPTPQPRGGRRDF
jgi:hypothetical protein